MQHKPRTKNCTFGIILNSKLDKWVGSNLSRTALAACSWTNEDDFCVSKRLLRASIASKGDDDEDIGGNNIAKTRYSNLYGYIIWV